MAYFKKGAQLERLSQGMVSQLEHELSIEEKDDLTAEEIASLSADEFAPKAFDAQSAEAVGYSNYSYWRCTFQAFWKNKAARFLLIALCVLLVFTLLQPILPGQKDPNEIFNEYDKYGKATPMKN